MNYRVGSHTKFNIEYHFVWPSYRDPVLAGEIAQRARELTRQVGDRLELHILGGVVSKDHVHLLVSARRPRRRPRACDGSKGEVPRSCLLSFRT